MSDDSLIDVLSETHETPEKTTAKCGYCDCEKEGLPVFYCDMCGKWVHSSCLLSGSPSPIIFDNYFNFKCVRCSDDGRESFARMKLTWNTVASLALYNIAQSSPGKDGFHKWKEVVVEFIERHWETLFGSTKKKTNTWVNTIAATLSAGNPHQFTSGYGFFKESGWWKLTDPNIPPEYDPHCTVAARAKEMKSRKNKLSYMATPSATRGEGSRKRSIATPNVTQTKEQKMNTQPEQCKSENAGNEDKADREKSPPSFKGCVSPVSSPPSSPCIPEEMMSTKEEIADPPLLGLQQLDEEDAEEQGETRKRIGNMWDHIVTKLVGASQTISQNERNESHPKTREEGKEQSLTRNVMAEVQIYRKTDEGPRSAFSPVRRRSIKVKATRTDEDQNAGLREMSLYEECSLLKKLESFGSGLKKFPSAYRLRRKLLVRQKKRELHLPIVGFDELVRNLVATGTAMPKSIMREHNARAPVDASGQLRILDRFQVGFSATTQESASYRSFRQKLVGCGDDEVPPAIVSPYTQRVLRPYIRRDYDSVPLKLELLREIRAHKKSSADEWSLRKSPIDYCYVRKCYISSINSLCHHFFWPEIDMTESLQYPDFSVVALYRKMVIGFGFMVPDVSFNEAYITFLFVHPDWRSAGIGTFMLYHLIQTCMGKDVTLHVSASNPAMLVYQKFGFKPEAFIADFYEKYYRPDSKECKHAFFMRLRR